MKDEISLKFQEIDMYYEPISEKHDSAIAELISFLYNIRS